MFTRPVHIGLSPNTSMEDYIQAAKTILQLWKWKTGSETKKVENWFKDYFGVDTAVSFNAGRSSLLALLKVLELPKGSEALIQAYTCVAVSNSIMWAGLTPMYVDIDESLNVDIDDAEKKLTPKTRVLIVQHTFGISADMEKIVAFCKKHKLILIEDCAHALGATYKGKLLGTFGDAAFFSFGRDKVVSAVFGGIATINAKCQMPNAKLKLENYQKSLPFPSFFWIFQQLLHPLISCFVLYTYHFFNIGKGILWLAQKMKLLSFPVYVDEKRGKQPPDFPKKFPNALAVLVLKQLQKLEKINHRREEISKMYFEKLAKLKLTLPEKQSGAIYLRFNLLTSRANEVRFHAKKQGMILGNWFGNVIDPKGVVFEKIGYKEGNCPKAEKIAEASLNLPTYPTLTQLQVEQICSLLVKTLQIE